MSTYSQKMHQQMQQNVCLHSQDVSFFGGVNTRSLLIIYEFFIFQFTATFNQKLIFLATIPCEEIIPPGLHPKITLFHHCLTKPYPILWNNRFFQKKQWNRQIFNKLDDLFSAVNISINQRNNRSKISIESHCQKNKEGKDQWDKRFISYLAANWETSDAIDDFPPLSLPYE